MKTKEKIPSRVKKIPPHIINKLNRDLAALAAEFTGMNRVRVKKSAQLYSQPNDGDEVLTLPGGSEHQVIGSYNNRLGIVHENLLYWTPQEHVESLPVHSSPAIIKTESSWWDRKREALITRAAGIRNEYLNNPYLRISGFSIEFGLPPSLTIDFEFKDKTS